MLVWLLLMSTQWDAPIIADASGVRDSRTAFTYDATEPKGRRASPKINHASEDVVLDQSKRSKLTANARDIRRNFSIASWMIRKHLDYVASFDFHCKSGDPGLDLAVETFVEEWSKKENFDASRRHRRAKMLRIGEALRCVEGDFGFMKLAAGKVQGIEGDRIRTPTGDRGDGWQLGVKTDAAGGALAYAVHRRSSRGGSFEFERAVPAANLILHGHFDRIDQIRGISPLAAALNPLRDVYEGFDYALAKAKVSQLFALVLTRQAYDAAGTVENEGTAEKPKYNQDFGRGPVTLDLEHGDDAKFLESNTPSTEFQNFTQLVIMVALKALDIPYSFYDEKHTNFFGSRGAWLHYDRACKDKRADLLEVLNDLTAWRLSLALIDNDLRLPRGKTLRDLKVEWVPAGMPWWDPAKEITGDLKAIGAGLDNPQRITKERGRGDWYANVDRIAEAMAYAKKVGVPLSFAVEPDPQQVEIANDE